MKYSAVIVAAGKGSRMGLGYNKVFFLIDDHTTVLEKTISIFQKDSDCVEIVVVVSADEYSRCIDKFQSGNVIFVSGGETRGHSVFNGLMAVSSDKVLIHDGARPYLSQECLNNVKKEIKDGVAVIPVVPVKDTIKHIVNNEVVTTFKRNELFQVQTPQAFETDLILGCYRKAFNEENYSCTDDGQIVELYSDAKIKAVEGCYSNIKITTIEDLQKIQ